MAQAPEILARIQAPVFPARNFVITNYGAVADGRTDCRLALARRLTRVPGRAAAAWWFLPVNFSPAQFT